MYWVEHDYLKNFKIIGIDPDNLQSVNEIIIEYATWRVVSFRLCVPERFDNYNKKKTTTKIFQSGVSTVPPIDSIDFLKNLFKIKLKTTNCSNMNSEPMNTSMQSRRLNHHGTPESEFSNFECFQNYTAPEVFVQGLGIFHEF